jgi:hypothetical protein
MDAPRDRLEELQLWDRDGLLYTRAKRNLPKRVARELLRDQAVQVAVSRGWPPDLVWLDSLEVREESWSVDLSGNLKGTPGWKPPREAPGQLPLEAELWEAQDGSRVLLFQDHD